ncbi:MAG: type II toxin-antitoxin system VapC family toxin [Alphaproteobacteria bacterium]|nr:type II toxin-antitoxin system VapC family toxin [Alphaproteobacteria bacterium]
MTCVIVNDASCLIDLRKGRLLPLMLKLPYRFIVPYPIRQDELLDFTALEWDMLEAHGLEVYDLLPEQVREAFAVKGRHPRLTAHDCMCLVTTRCHDAGILLTGDRALRNAAQVHDVEVHGVLWIVDELRDKIDGHEAALVEALTIWRNDPSVFLPENEILRRLSAFPAPR